MPCGSRFPSRRWDMHRRWLLLGLGAGTLLGAVFGVFVWITFPPTGVNWENYERIHQGMTRQQLEAILGCPPGNYRSRPYKVVTDDKGSIILGKMTVHVGYGDRTLYRNLNWDTDDASISVYLDERGRVVFADFSSQ